MRTKGHRTRGGKAAPKKGPKKHNNERGSQARKGKNEGNYQKNLGLGDQVFGRECHRYPHKNRRERKVKQSCKQFMLQKTYGGGFVGTREERGARRPGR